MTDVETRPPPPAAAGTLLQIAAEVQREHELCEAHYRTALAHAFRCGELLIEAKGQLAHGAWQAWLATHCSFSDRTARGYMQAARHRSEVERRPVAVMGLRAALRELAAPRPARRPVAQALRDLGSVEGSMEEVASWHPSEPAAAAPSFRSTGIWRKALADLDVAARRAELCRRTIAETRGLVPEAVVDLLDEMCAHHRELLEQAELLRGYVMKGRPPRR